MPALPVHITGLAAASALSDSPEGHLTALNQGRSGLRPLGEFPGLSGLPASMRTLPAGWLPDDFRADWLRGRRYGAASNAAVRAARLASADAGWSSADLREAWVFAGSSRANVGELLGTWSQRRPIRKFRASNSMHSEVAAAVSIELGIQGPWQMLANGCSAGLDALGLAWAALHAGLARRAVVIGVELPLCRELLQGFADTGLLAGNTSALDPYHPETTGFHPGEAVAALTLESGARSDCPEIITYAANSDAYDSIALPPDGEPLARLIAQALLQLEMTNAGRIAAICPHGNGTPSNRQTECAAIQKAFRPHPTPAPLVSLLKPATGHSLGASGALEVAILAAALREGCLPANLPYLTPPRMGWQVPAQAPRLRTGDIVLKWSLGMGGHNALLALRCRKDA